MWIKQTIDIWRWKNQILNDITKAVVEVSQELHLELQINSPVASGQYISQHRIKPVQEQPNAIVWGVENIGEYSEKVEEWWRSKSVNWNLKNGQIYHSKWANVYEKSVQNKKDLLFKKLIW